MKSSEGCLKRCIYCLIPLIKGPLRSKTIHQVKKEFLDLLKKEVKEIILIAQDLSDYGKDLREKRYLERLLKELLKEKKDFSNSHNGCNLKTEQFSENISFDSLTTKNITIANLKELKQKKEEQILGKEDVQECISDNRIEDKNCNDKELNFLKKDKKEDLSQDEINNIIFGKKL